MEFAIVTGFMGTGVAMLAYFGYRFWQLGKIERIEWKYNDYADQD